MAALPASRLSRYFWRVIFCVPEGPCLATCVIAFIVQRRDDPLAGFSDPNSSIAAPDGVSDFLFHDIERIIAASSHGLEAVLFRFKNLIEVGSLRFGGHKRGIFLCGNIEVKIKVTVIAEFYLKLAPTRLISNGCDGC